MNKFSNNTNRLFKLIVSLLQLKSYNETKAEIRKIIIFFPKLLLTKYNRLNEILITHKLKNRISIQNLDKYSDFIGYECIIFSKDRPMQLDALLRSMYKHVKNGPAKIYILYKSDKSKMLSAYKECISFHNKDNIKFCLQSNNFKNDLLGILSKIKSNKIFFLVDDIVFTEPVNLDIFNNIDLTKYVPSLRHGLNLKKCYTFNETQPLPPTYKFNDKLIYWYLNQGYYDWSYSLSVDGHIFLTQEILSITELINFKAPNTYEGNMQVFKNFYSQRKGICYNKSRIVNIACNKVQTEHNNLYGKLHQSELLNKWNDGYRIDIDKLSGLNNISVHIDDIDFRYIKQMHSS